MKNLIEILVEKIEKYKPVRTFGVLGREASQIGPRTLDALNFISTSHEAAAGFSAAACSRHQDMLGCVFTTLGPGATNVVTAVANAFLDHDPILVICAQAESHDLHYGLTHQCVDQTKIFDPICIKSLEISSFEISQLTELSNALEILNRHPSGPVVVSIPIDLMSRELTAEEAKSILSEDSKKIGTLSTFLDVQSSIKISESSKPIAFVGDIAARSSRSEEIKNLLIEKKIPVMTSYNAKGFLDEKNELSLGVASPYVDAVLGASYFASIFSKCDTILLFDTNYSEDIRESIWNYGSSKKAVFLASETEFRYPDEIREKWHCTSIDKLVEAVSKLSTRQFEFDNKNRLDKSSKEKAFRKNNKNSGDIAQLYEALSIEPYRFIVDVGLHRAIAGVLLNTSEIGQFTTSVGLSSFGFSIPYAMGASHKIGEPQKRKIVVVCGDAGFASALPDLDTINRLNLNMSIIVIADNSHSLIDLYSAVGQKGEISKYTLGSSKRPSDVSRSMGWKSFRTTDVSAVINILRDENRTPTLIEFPTEYPLGFLLEGVSGAFREFVHE